MAKTSTQLDREIEAALGLPSLPPFASGDYYYVADRGRHRTIYGPYVTRKDAEYAGYFHKPVAERDATPANVFFMRGVQGYDEDEIKSLIRYPAEYELASAKLAHRPPPMHPSWKKLGDDEFRQHLRDKDYDLVGRLARR